MTERRSSRDRIVLAVMARAPTDEQGKTRLLSVLGSDAGEDLRRAILLDTLDVARQVSAVDLAILFAPVSATAELTNLAGDATVGLIPQRGDALGERLDNAFSDLFARHYTGVVIMGSDLPTLPPTHVESAVSALTRQVDPVVLGPTLDGGYYLIGLRKHHPELFRGSPWSTDAVCDTTADIANRGGLAVSLAPAWYDVDSVHDLHRVVEAPDNKGRRTRAWVTARFDHRSRTVRKVETGK